MAFDRAVEYEKIVRWLEDQAGYIKQSNSPEALLVIRLANYKKDWHKLLLDDGGMPLIREFAEDAVKAGYRGTIYTYR